MTHGNWLKSLFALLAVVLIGASPLLAQDETPAEETPATETSTDESKSTDDAPDDTAPANDDAPADDDAEDAPATEETPAEPPKDNDNELPEAAPEPGPQAKAWKAKLAEWKMLLSDMNLLRAQYNVAKEEDAPKIRDEYNAKLEQGREMLAELKTAARAAFEEAPNEDREVVRFLVKIAADEIRAERYESGFEAAQFLIDHGCEHKPIYNIAGVAAFGTNRIDLAKEYLDKANELDAFSPEGREAHSVIEQHDLVKLWEAETKIREAEADDELPRVKLTTSQGDIVVELFENEAPDTVGNFVSLVEKGFYDGRLFHRVLPGFMAQTGCPNGDGFGGPGYKIYCETDKEDHRKHFAGSLAMAHAGPNTGGSQFYLTFQPRPQLDGRHTVFGRVIEGWDVLAKIQRYDPSSKSPKPALDKIEVAEVIRKRDHEYKPNKVN